MKNMISRRQALAKLGLIASAAYVLPTLASVSEAQAGGRKKKSKKSGKSGGSGGSGGGSGGSGGGSGRSGHGGRRRYRKH